MRSWRMTTPRARQYPHGAMSQRILLVEDDEELGQQIIDSLQADGFQADWIKDGDEAMRATLESYAMVVLDLMLPGAHGLDVLRKLRTRDDLPVLILSARNETSDKVRALELGADDYMTKPFWPEELRARIHARLRRPGLEREGAISVGELVLELDGRRVVVAGKSVELTRVEFDLLASLARRKGKAVTRGWLVEQILDPDREGGERTLDVHVSRLRKKLGAAGRHLATVWGVGYRLEEETGP